MCRMQQHQPPSASHTHTPTHPARLIKDTASQWPLLQPLWSRLDIKGEEKLFTSVIRRNEAGEQGTIIPPFNSQKRSRLNFFFSLHLYKWGSPDQRRIVGKQGGPESIWWWWQVRKLKKKKLWNKVRRGTFERADLMLDRPSRIHSHGCWVSKQQFEPCNVSSALKHHAGGCKRPSANGSLFLPLSASLPLPLCSHRTWQLSVFVLSLSLSAHLHTNPVSKEIVKEGSTPPSFPAPTPPSCCSFSSLWCFTGRCLNQSSSTITSLACKQLVSSRQCRAFLTRVVSDRREEKTFKWRSNPLQTYLDSKIKINLTKSHCVVHFCTETLTMIQHLPIKYSTTRLEESL